MIQRNLTPCAGQGINPLLTDGADVHKTPTPRTRPLSAVGVVAAVAPVTPEATHVRAVLVEVRLPRGLLCEPPRGRALKDARTAVAEAQAAGRPVFVDFTAAWCVSCQVNKLGTLSDSRVRDVFAQQDVALFRADFTNRDPVIADALARHGAAGVPLYLVYPPESGDPEVLPPLLTSGIVIRAVNDAVN